MRVNWRLLVVTVSLIGFLVVGLTGSSTSMTFIWPGYLIVGLAGVLSIVSLFQPTWFKVPKWCFGSVFLLLAYLLARASHSPVLYFSREDSSLLVVCFLCYAIFIALFTEPGWRNLILWAVVGLVTVNLALAVWQQFVSPGQWILPGYERTFQNQVGGVFNNPDHFACFLGASLPLIMAAVLFGKLGKTVRLGLIFLAVSAAVGVVAARSDLAILTTAIGIGVFFLLSLIIVWKNLNSAARKSTIAVLLTAGILSGGFLFAHKIRLAHAVDGRILTKGNAIHLPDVWKAAHQQFSVSPFFGTGSRSFYYYGRRFRPGTASGNSSEAEFVHNEYLQTLSDYGLTGLMLMLVVLLFHLGNGIKFVRGYVGFFSEKGKSMPQSDHLALALGAIGGLTVIGSQSAFDFVMHIPSIAVSASFMLAILACPDPKSNPTAKQGQHYLPGGVYLFVTRALSFGGGIALICLGVVFTRSEWQFEQARLAFQSNHRNYQLFRHLQSARRLDPRNPFIYSLSAHAHVAAIDPGMAEPARIAALEKAESYFAAARQLYPHDIFAAIGHSAVLDALGQGDRAGELLRDARQWAPTYGCLMQAQAEHSIRQGNMKKAEEFYQAARNAGAFRNIAAADRGLKAIDNWKRMAFLNKETDSPHKSASSPEIKNAEIEEKSLSGKAGN